MSGTELTIGTAGSTPPAPGTDQEQQTLEQKLEAAKSELEAAKSENAHHMKIKSLEKKVADLLDEINTRDSGSTPPAPGADQEQQTPIVNTAEPGKLTEADEKLHPGLIKIKIQYPDDYVADKFYPNGHETFVGKEIADQFVELGIATII